LARTGDPWVEVIGVKLYADGWLGPRTCALCEPFTDRPGEAGTLFMDPDRLARRVAPWAASGWTVATHAIGDRAAAAVLDAYDAVWGGDCHVAAPRIEHAQVLSIELIERMASMGVVACIQPSFATTDADAARAALGAERLRTAYAWDGLLAAGVPVITGSDYPIEDLDPLVGLARLQAGSPISAPLDPAVVLGLMTDAAAGTTTLSADPLDDTTDTAQIVVERTDPSPG
jgi:predicted amidohydrolase YtcJ